MKKTVALVVATVVATLALLLLALVAVARSGAVDVAATADYLPGAEWFLSTLSEASIAAHAAKAVERGEIVVPPEAGEAELAEGARLYEAMCVACHGAPGVERGEIGQGLEPVPPELGHVGEELTPAEIYWVLENGIRHTGMPAFGPTHGDRELWAITAFVGRLGGLTPEEYRERAGPPTGGHGHGAGGHGHGGDGHGADAPAAPPSDPETEHDHDDHDH